MTDFKFNGENTIIPEGIYRVTDTIVLGGCLLKGAGIDKTILVADFDDPKKAIFHMGWTSKLENMTICFKDGLVTGNEQFGERVAIYTKSHWPLQKCAYIRNVKIDNVGTGIHSVDIPSISFSVMFKNITITNFSFRGFDISSPYRTGNIYSNLYLSSGKFRCDSAFYFGAKESGDEESETTLDNLLIYDTVARIPLHFEAARGLIAQNITLDNVSATESLLFWQDSDGCIDEFNIKNSRAHSNSMIRIGTTSKYSQWSAEYFRIKNLRLHAIKGINNELQLFERNEEYTDTYYVKVDNYDVSSCENTEHLERFPTSGTLVFTQKGEPLNKERLCIYYSKNLDAETGRELTWNGTQWC